MREGDREGRTLSERAQGQTGAVSVGEIERDRDGTEMLLAVGAKLPEGGLGIGERDGDFVFFVFFFCFCFLVGEREGAGETVGPEGEKVGDREGDLDFFFAFVFDVVEEIDGERDEERETEGCLEDIESAGAKPKEGEREGENDSLIL